MTIVEKPVPSGEFGVRPTHDSLLQATVWLESVLASAPAADPWYAELRAALQACVLAVEYHLDALEGASGMKQHISREEPRLIPYVERLDAAMNQLLLGFWEAKESAAHPLVTLVQPLRQLAVELRRVADGELDLLHESLIGTVAED